MSQGFVIAIDGPSASGKGTIAPLLAKQLEGFYLDTGVFYRCLAFYCLEQGVETTSEGAVVARLPEIAIDFIDGKAILNSQNVTDLIRTSTVSQGSSQVAAFASVQEYMVKREQEIANRQRSHGKIIVAEGRNIATAVFPDAEAKIYLTASVEVRAKRRLAQLQAKGQRELTYEAVLADTKERDERDTTRESYPLVTEPEKYGYWMLEDSDLSEEETISAIVSYLQTKQLL